MSETNETADKTLRSGARKPLSLKRTEASGHVQQSFSHGRKNVVVVERKKRRTLAAPGQGPEEEGHAPAPGAGQANRSAKGPSGRDGALRQDELEARNRALAANREREAVEARQRVDDEKREAEERKKAEAEAAAARKAEGGAAATTEAAQPAADGQPAPEIADKAEPKKPVVAEKSQEPGAAPTPSAKPDARKPWLKPSDL